MIALAPDFFEEGAAFTGDDIYVALDEFAFRIVLAENRIGIWQCED